MVIRVALALVGAGTARCQARLQRVQLRWGMRIGLASQDAHGAGACVRAIEAEANAADEVADVVLGYACVRTDRAGRLARAALVEASRQHSNIGDQCPRVGSQDVLDAHALLLAVVRHGCRDDLAPATQGHSRSRPLDVRHWSRRAPINGTDRATDDPGCQSKPRRCTSTPTSRSKNERRHWMDCERVAPVRCMLTRALLVPRYATAVSDTSHSRAALSGSRAYAATPAGPLSGASAASGCASLQSSK